MRAVADTAPETTAELVVLRGGRQIEVRVSIEPLDEPASEQPEDNGREFPARIVGTDPRTDIAVLRVDAPNLAVARFGDSDVIEVGDWVLAIGSPFNYAQTVTAGIISAKGRTVGVLREQEGYEDFLQTDAAINPGNSGGPLLNLRGEVIGINTAIASQSGGFNGLGFAIPSNMVRAVESAIVSKGHVSRGRLGAYIQDLDEDLAEQLGVKPQTGVLIGDVQPNGPATKAGLRSGDIVVQYQGRPVQSAKELRSPVRRSPDITGEPVVTTPDSHETSCQTLLSRGCLAWCGAVAEFTR